MSQMILKDTFNWFHTVVRNKGEVFIGSSIASGKNRGKIAVEKAMFSPVSNGVKIINSKSVLLLITCGSDEITLDEIGEINDYIQEQSVKKTNIIMTVYEDNNLEDDAIGITIIATGFESSNNSSQTHSVVSTK